MAVDLKDYDDFFMSVDKRQIASALLQLLEKKTLLAPVGLEPRRSPSNRQRDTVTHPTQKAHT